MVTCDIKQKKITSRLKGGLGNMLFIIAGIEYLGYSQNVKTFYYNVDANLHYLNNEINHNPLLKHAFEYKTIFKNFHWHSESIANCNKQIVPFEYVPITVNKSVNTEYDGFFQSEKYFPNSIFIWNLFTPSNLIQNYLKKYNYLKSYSTCAVHIRRGDYLKLSHIHTPQTLAYYKKAMSLMSVQKYILFSDDIQWCKNEFQGNEFVFIENEKDYIEIFLQAQCNHNIISNSTFGWWGAYLNKNKNKKVIAPAKWFGSDKHNGKDVVPLSWKKI